MRSCIVGVSGLTLTEAEAATLLEFSPLGVILFGRNVRDPGQLSALIAGIRASLPDGALLMVDQEGGRVARLRPPHWRGHPPARALPDARAAWLTGALIGLDCAAAGFDVVAAPVLDVGDPAGHDVIGDRAFSDDPERVATLGRAFAEGLLAAGMQPVGKHAPGHGRARADSHVSLPELDDISERDLLPFSSNRWLPWLMTAHIRYRTLDMQPATQSATIIGQVIRGRIGFDGILVSDDLAMQALSGTPGERSARAIAAGCDVALHCSGILDETRDVLASVGPASAATLDRLAAAREMARSLRQALDADALAAERAALLA